MEDQHFAKLCTIPFWCGNLQSGLIGLYAIQLMVYLCVAGLTYQPSSPISSTTMVILVIILSLCVLTVCVALTKVSCGKPKSLTLMFTMKWMITLQILDIWVLAVTIVMLVQQLLLTTVFFGIHPTHIINRSVIAGLFVAQVRFAVTMCVCYASHRAQEAILEVSDESNQTQMSSFSARRALSSSSQSPFWCCNLRTGLIVVYTMEAFCLFWKVATVGVLPATYIPRIAMAVGAPGTKFWFVLDAFIIVAFSMMALIALIKVRFGAPCSWKLVWSVKCMMFIGIWICCEAIISISYDGYASFMMASAATKQSVLEHWCPAGSLLLGSFVFYVSFEALGVLHSVSVAASSNVSRGDDAQLEIP